MGGPSKDDSTLGPVKTTALWALPSCPHLEQNPVPLPRLVILGLAKLYC